MYIKTNRGEYFISENDDLNKIIYVHDIIYIQHLYDTNI